MVEMRVAGRLEGAGDLRGSGAGTRDDPWRFHAGAGQPASIAYRDKSVSPPMLVVEVGGQAHRYPLDRLDDLEVAIPPLVAVTHRRGLAHYARALIRRKSA